MDVLIFYGRTDGRQNSGDIGKYWEISKVEGNLPGGGDGFPNTSLVLVEHGYSPMPCNPSLILF